MSDSPMSPSPALWRARQVLWAALTVLVLAVGVSVGWLAGSSTAGLAILGCLLVVAASFWVGLRGRYRSWRYWERADDLVVARGVLLRRETVVPYGRMQFVDVTAGPIDRWFGLATVQLHTAAAATDARIPGLLRADAERLRDRLAQLGEARAAGL